MPAGDQSCFVTSIMFNGIDEMHTCLLVVRWWSVSLPFVDECFALINLVEFQFFGISPFHIAIILVHFHSLVMIPGYKKSAHACGFGPE